MGKKVFDSRNRAFKEVLKVPQVGFEASKAFLAYSLAIEPRAENNPRRTLFVESFFEPIKPSSVKELKQANIQKYANKVNEVSGTELIVKKKISHKRVFYFVDATKLLNRPVIDKPEPEIIKHSKEVSETLNATFDPFTSQGLFNRTFFYLDAFFYQYNFKGNIFPLHELNKIKSLKDLKLDLNNRLKRVETGFDFFSNFMEPRWLQQWKNDFWLKPKMRETPKYPLDLNLHAQKKALEIISQ